MNDETDDLRKLIEANARPWNSMFYWRDKPIGERGAASEIFQAAGVKLTDFVSRPKDQDPPDCEGMLDGQWSGVEVTELIHEPTVKRAMKARKERAAGREPEKTEAYYVWDRDKFLSAIQAHINKKDAAQLKGGPYKRYVLVIHTDEAFLNRSTVHQFLERAKFQSQLITDVFIGLYEAGFGVATFRLELDRASAA